MSFRVAIVFTVLADEYTARLAPLPLARPSRRRISFRFVVRLGPGVSPFPAEAVQPFGLMTRANRHNACQWLIHPITSTRFARSLCMSRSGIRFNPHDQYIRIRMTWQVTERAYVGKVGPCSRIRPSRSRGAPGRGRVLGTIRKFTISRNAEERNASYAGVLSRPQRTGVSPQIVQHSLRSEVRLL